MQTENQKRGDWGVELTRELLMPFFPKIQPCKNPNEKYVDFPKPLVQSKMRSYPQYGDMQSHPQNWEPTREYLENALKTYPDYLIVLLFHDGKTPHQLVYGALLSAKEALNGSVEWADTKKDGLPAKKIALVSMHKRSAQWPKVIFFNNKNEFREKAKPWLEERKLL